MHAPDLMPILSAGSHANPSEGACVMEMASFLAGEAWSDTPDCTHPVLAKTAQKVNDTLPDSERGVLLDLLPRLMGTAPTGTEDERRRLSVALAVWCAEQVVHLTGGAEQEARGAIRVARAWLAGDATAGDCAAAANAVAYAGANAGANAAANAAYSAADAAYAAVAYAAYHAAAANAAYSAANAAYSGAGAGAGAAHEDAHPVGLLVGLLDEYDRLTGRDRPSPLAPADVQRLAALTTGGDVMSAADLPALVVYAADGQSVTFGRGTLPEVSVSMAQTAKATEHVIGDGRTILGGYPVDRQDITSLMNAMRAAAGLTRCDRCNQWTDTGALCDECATHVLTEQERYDIRAEKRAERAADFASNWD